MKTKKLGKMLTLKKKTIANLSNVEMTAIVGAGSTNPVPSWNCNTLPFEFTCICEEFRTQCTKCDC